MRKQLLILLIILSAPVIGYSQCTTLIATTCKCQDSTQTNCDLYPDITVSRNPLNNPSNYTEYPQVCNPPCSGNDGRLRLSVTTPNIGHGPIETRGTPTYVCGTDTFTASSVATIPATCPVTGLPPRQLIYQRIYHKNGSTMTYSDRPAGTMTFHASHGHQHVDDWGEYTVRTATADPNPANWPIIGTGAKLAFCLLDIGSCNGNVGSCVDSLGNNLNSTNMDNYGLGGGNYGCSNVVQGISAGYVDIYSQGLDGMWVNLPPGLCNGNYWVVVEVDPNNNFLEERKWNNIVAVPITLTKQMGSVPVVTTSGSTTFCAGGSVTLTCSAATDYLWSTGATTASIVVNQAGSYTVTIDNSSPCPATSTPTTVTVSSLAVSATATPNSVCPGSDVQLNSTVSGSGTTLIPVNFTNNTVVPIPDNNATGASSSVTVSGIVPSTLATNSVAKVKVNITHTYDGDLTVSLISPSGNTILLSNRRGGGGNNFTNTEFVATGGTAIGSGSPPFTGLYIPDQPFSNLTGLANGTWTLKVVDLAGTDVGTIDNWTLSINNTAPATYSYAWSSPSGFSSTQQNPITNPAASTSYTVTATESGTGCTGSQTANVTVGSNIVVTTNTPAPICSGESAVLTASGAATYTWSPSTGLNTTTGASVTASPAVTTTYTVIGNSSGCTDTAEVTVTVNASPQLVVPGAQTICDGNSVTLNVSGADSYDWDPSSGLNVTSGPSVVAFPNATTVYTVTGTNLNGCSASSTITVNVNTIPAIPAAVTGNSHNCLPVANAAYSIANVAGATSYSWTAPAGMTITGGQGTNAITLSGSTVVTGNLCVNASNVCGTSGDKCVTYTTQTSTPSTPGSVTGPLRACPGETVTYSVANVARATFYNWVTPAGVVVNSGAGTNSINVTFTAGFVSSAITVAAGNGCGISGNRVRNVTLNTPGTPGSMSGPTTGLCGSLQTYAVTAVAGMTYTWTVPAGATIIGSSNTNSINVQFSSSFTPGTIGVTASNLCGTSAQRIKNVRGTTAQPSAINGVTSVCTGQTNVSYSITPLAGAVTYLWTVPNGCTITSGQGTTSILVTMSANAVNGSVTARGVNSCGNGSSRSLAIAVNSCPKFADNTDSGDKELTIYPNPASEYVEVMYRSSSDKDGLVKLIDMLGQTKYKQSLDVKKGANSYMIDVRRLPAGVYFVSLEQDGKRITQRLVVN
jgi:subtilisin-like proprotein convertase family protein